MNHALVKLVDAALLPAALMVVSKLIGLAVTISVFKLPWSLVQVADGLGFSSITPAVNLKDLGTISTYSDLIMLVIMSLCFSVVLLQVTVLHQKQIKPSLLVRLSNANLMGLVKSSYDIYQTASIWLLFLWITTITIGFNSFLGKTEVWVGVVAFAAASIFTTLLLQDVYKEIKISRKTLGKQSVF
jgi:hypothetical protein